VWPPVEIVEIARGPEPADSVIRSTSQGRRQPHPEVHNL
jgi:hypothetical protein